MELIVTSIPKTYTTSNCPKMSTMDTEIGSSSVFGVLLFNVTEVENHQLCVDSSSTIISKLVY